MSREKIDDAIRRQNERIRHNRAMDQALRGVKYVMSLLPDMGFEFRPIFNANPIELHLKIWWSEEEGGEGLLPTLVREKLAKIEKQLAEISHGVGDTQIPKPVTDDRTG